MKMLLRQRLGGFHALGGVRELGTSRWLLGATVALCWPGGSGALKAHDRHEPCFSSDTVNSPGCFKHLPEDQLLLLLSGNSQHPFPFPVVCTEVVGTPQEARAILSTGGRSPCAKLKRDLLTTIFNIRRSVLFGDGRLGDDGVRCFLGGGDDDDDDDDDDEGHHRSELRFRIVLCCGPYVVPDLSTSDPNDAAVITEKTPLSLYVEYANQLCGLSGCPDTSRAPCGRTLNSLASYLNRVNSCSRRHGDCGLCDGDTTPPVLSCPTGVLEFECQGHDGGPIHYSVSATDDCQASPSVTGSPPSGATLPTGSTRVVTCTARDAHGNEAQCAFEVRIVDTKPPTICVPEGPIVVDCEEAGPNGAIVNYPDATAWDRCDERPSVVCSPPSGSLFPFGVTTVVCTATDSSGNSAQGSFEVQVQEGAPPALTCPGDITVDCAGPEGAVVEYPLPMATSSCGVPAQVSCEPPSGSMFPRGETVVRCAAQTDRGRLECSFRVTVIDRTPPVITCPGNVVIQCMGYGGAFYRYDVGVSDVCDDSPRVDCSPASGTYFPLGTTTVRCTASDDAGNSSECGFTVTVIDTEPPRITCPDGPIRVSCTSSEPGPGAIVQFPEPVVSDDCGADVQLLCSHHSGDFFPLGVTTVTCRAIDQAGNEADCSFQVEVGDGAPPMLVCPGDLLVECESPDGAVVEYPAPVVADICDGEPIVACDPPSGSLFPIGTTTVHCSARDAAGNRVTCSFDITVGDNTPPQILCPANRIIECAGPYAGPVAFSVSAIDNCDPDPVVVCDPPSGTVFDLGVTTVRCRAVDASGNESACSFEVHVLDTLPPRILCPERIVAECTSSEGALVLYVATAGDDCQGAVNVVCDPPSGSLFAPGITVVVCTAADSSGNIARCEFEVEVVDRTPPQISCPDGAIVLECNEDGTAAAAYTEPSATDNCSDAVTVACDPPPGTPLALGTHTIVCVAEDSAGNSSMCSFEVKVVDTAPPALNCPGDIVVECQGPGGTPVEYALPTPTDACGGAPGLSCLPASGSLFPQGDTLVVCTADDQDGNMVQCSFTVSVVDTRPPEIACPEDIRVACASVEGARVEYSVAALDLCDPAPQLACEPPSGHTFPPGTTQVTCIARDRHGNEASCSFRVIVEDTTAPRIECPESFVWSCAEGGSNVVEYPLPRVLDDCDPAPTVTCEPPPGTSLSLGPHAVRCVARDSAGNESTCEFTVTVVASAPLLSLVCPPDVTVECDGPGGTVVEYETPALSDPCSGPFQVACTPPSGSLFALGVTEVVCVARDESGNEATCAFLVTVEDTTAPVLSCPEDVEVTVECSSSAGAMATYSVSAEDICDGPLDVDCSPSSGAIFPTGKTSVNCVVVDGAGNEARCSFTVSVVDRTPPEVTCPPEMVAQGTSSGTSPHKPPGWPPGSNPPPNMVSAVVTYGSVASTDTCLPGTVSVTCSPPSGTRFELGTHTVTCTARDGAGNTKECSFEVTVVAGLEFKAFIRGDANADSLVDIADPIWIINFLFLGGPPPRCYDSSDSNDDGRLDITDPLYTLNYTFQGGPRPPAPFFPFCGLDPSIDSLDCFRYAPCE